MRLDELSGIDEGQHADFCRHGGKEWWPDWLEGHSARLGEDTCNRRVDDPGDGKGAGWVSNEGGEMCFWDGRSDPARNAQRMARLDAIFKAKYPGVPGDVPPPACGW